LIEEKKFNYLISTHRNNYLISTHRNNCLNKYLRKKMISVRKNYSLWEVEKTVLEVC